MKLGMLVAPVTMLAYNKFGQDLELTHIRLAFVTSICVVAAFLYLLYQAIQQSRDQQPVEFEVKSAGKPTEKQTLPAATYDAQEFSKLLKKIAPGILIVTALHCWKGFMQPLVVQCVTIPVTLLESPLFQVYILKKAATGSLARPWKEESPFAALTKATTETADEPATAASSDSVGTAGAQPVVQNGS
ncbi:TPA: hypothetical protein ACH3X1_010374 [Trebouxia sp. C0004]